MNGYAIYKVQTRSSIKDKQVKEIIPSPVSSLVGQKCSLKIKKVSCEHYLLTANFSFKTFMIDSLLHYEESINTLCHLVIATVVAFSG